MRPNLADLAKYHETRVTMQGSVRDFGATPRNRRLEPTIVIQNVTRPDGTPVCKECWFTLGKRFRDQQLQVGDRIEFSARLTIHGRLIRLRYPMHIRKLDGWLGLVD